MFNPKTPNCADMLIGAVGNASSAFRKTPKNKGSVYAGRVTRPLRFLPENAEIHDKSVGFGVLDEPIRRRRIIW